MIAIILNIHNQRQMTRNKHIRDCELIISRWVRLCVIFVYFLVFFFFFQSSYSVKVYSGKIFKWLCIKSSLFIHFIIHVIKFYCWKHFKIKASKVKKLKSQINSVLRDNCYKVFGVWVSTLFHRYVYSLLQNGVIPPFNLFFPLNNKL